MLKKLILKVLEEYPKQALWIFSSVVKSTKSNREQRGRDILDRLKVSISKHAFWKKSRSQVLQKNNPGLAETEIPSLVKQILAMTDELLLLCDRHIKDEKKTLHMQKDFPGLAKIGCCDLIIPLRESLTASLPPASAEQSTHQPFPPNLPMFHGGSDVLQRTKSSCVLKLSVAEFFDEIEIMRSLAKPRKISIRGTDGQTYTFLGKPKDDLRKDARLMEFNSIINKLLKANSESRKRQLRKSFFFFKDCCWFPTCYRYPNIWGGDLEWRMWFHSVGPKHSTRPTSSGEELRCQTNQKLGMNP